MQYLRANTEVKVRVGPFVDVIDGFTPETGITLGAADEAELLKHNGAATIDISSATWSAVSDCDGWYDLTLTSSHTDTEGLLEVIVQDASLCLPVHVRFMVLAQAAYDSLFAAKDTGYMDVNVKAISDDTGAADNLELMYDGTGYTDETAPASRSQVGALATGSAAISTTAESRTLGGSEPETNSYTDTVEEDGTYHIVEDDGGTTDVYYQFNIGGDGVPTVFTWTGYAQSNGDDYIVQIYNWISSTWEQVGTIEGSNGTTPMVRVWQATLAHVGSGDDLGKVRLRFYSTTGTAIATDRLLCSFSVVARSAGYEAGAIWVDTSLDNTNTESYVDGVADNPVSTWAAALTLSSQLNLHKFILAPGSSITLSGNSDNYSIIGYSATVALAGQSVSGAYFEGCIITGDDDGSNTIPTRYRGCKFSDSTLGRHELCGCSFTGNITLAEAGDYLWDQCVSFASGDGTPDVTFPAGNANLNVRHYSGGMEVNSMAAGDSMRYEGEGELKIAASCTGGTIAIRGCIGPVTDEASGAVTLIEDARIAELNDISPAQVNAEVLDVLNVDTFAEPGQGTPPATTSLINKIGYLYKFLINKITNDGSETKVYNNASSVVDQKASTTDSAGTFTRDKFETGP